MEASNWLAGLAGGLDAVEHRRERDEDLKLANRKVDNVELAAQVRAMLEQVKEEGRNSRTDKTEGGKTARATAAETGKNDRFYDSEAGKNERLDTVEMGKNTRQGNALDQSSEQYWDNANRQWSGMMMGDATRRRGQDMSADTALNGQELAHGDRQDALGQGANATRARTALGILGVKARQKSSIFGDTGNPTDWAAEFDRLYNQPDDNAAPAPAPGPMAPPPPPAPAGVPGGGLPPRPAMPGGRAPGGAVAPAPAPAAPAGRAAAGVPAPAPKGLQVGATVKLKNGQTVVVKKVNPDGTFEY